MIIRCLIFIVMLGLLPPLALAQDEVTKAPEMTPKELAVRALKSGDYASVEAWYSHLSARDKRLPDNLFVATFSSINDLDFPLAHKRMELYNDLRLRSEKDRTNRSLIDSHLHATERMLANLRVVTIHNADTATLDQLLAQVQSEIKHLGRVTKDTYTTPDGKTKWEVSISPDSTPCFLVVHRLGDGSWDRSNAEIVIVRGLSQDVTLSYPFLQGDGNTLYFAIEEHSLVPSTTLGGKDIFVSRYDRESGSLLVPTQLPLPFNSSVDDFCYIIDEQSDFGWLISARNAKADSLVLYTFAPSTVQRYQGEDQREVAKWKAPNLTHKHFVTTSKSELISEHAPIYFWVHNRAIRGVEDLPNTTAREAFSKYLQIYNAYNERVDSLEKEREHLRHFDDTQSADESIKKRMLATEECIEELRVQLKAIRNEVINQCTNNNK